MQVQGKIDVRFLDQLQKTKFSSRIPKLTRWYAASLTAFKNRDELPYAPTVFVVPFYMRIESRVGQATKILRMVGLTSVDPDDPPKKWAIYVPYSVVKNAPMEINIATLAHEIAHFSLRAKGAEAFTPDDVLQASKMAKTAAERSFFLYWIKEREVSNAESLFEEPIRTMMLKMEEQKVRNPEVAKKYLANMQGLTQDEFYTRILGHDVAEKVFEEQFRRMMKRLGLET